MHEEPSSPWNPSGYQSRDWWLLEHPRERETGSSGPDTGEHPDVWWPHYPCCPHHPCCLCRCSHPRSPAFLQNLENLPSGTNPTCGMGPSVPHQSLTRSLTRWWQLWHPAQHWSHPTSLLSPGLGSPASASCWDGGTEVPNELCHHHLSPPPPLHIRAPSCPLPVFPVGLHGDSQRQLGFGSGPSARSPWLIVLPPRPPHAATCLPLSTLLGHPCCLPACPRPLNELKK